MTVGTELDVHLGQCITQPPQDGLFVGGQIMSRAVVSKLRVGWWWDVKGGGSGM